MGFYSAIKKTEIVVFASRWMEVIRNFAEIPLVLKNNEYFLTYMNSYFEGLDLCI